MQDQSSLSAEDIELIKVAGEHVKDRFEKDFISIGSVPYVLKMEKYIPGSI